MKSVHIRYSLSLSLTILFTSFAADMNLQIPPLVINSIEKNAPLWAATRTSLSPSSLEVLANFLYLSYRHAYLDEQTGRALIALKKTLPLVSTQIHSPDNPLPTTLAYLRASKRFFVFNGLRYHIYLCWQQCTDYLESIEDPALKYAYEQLQYNGKNIIIEYLGSIPTISMAITQLQTNLQHTTKRFNEINFAIEALREKIAITDHPDDRLTDTDSALFISNQIQKATDLLSAPLAILDHHQNNLLLISAHFFHNYYAALYGFVPVIHRRLLFGPKGLLAEQDQHQLPSPKCIASDIDKISKSIA